MRSHGNVVEQVATKLLDKSLHTYVTVEFNQVGTGAGGYLGEWDGFNSFEYERISVVADPCTSLGKVNFPV